MSMDAELIELARAAAALPGFRKGVAANGVDFVWGTGGARWVRVGDNGAQATTSWDGPSVSYREIITGDAYEDTVGNAEWINIWKDGSEDEVVLDLLDGGTGGVLLHLLEMGVTDGGGYLQVTCCHGQWWVDIRCVDEGRKTGKGKSLGEACCRAVLLRGRWPVSHLRARKTAMDSGTETDSER